MEGSLAEGGEIVDILTELKPASQYAFVGKGFLKKGESAHRISGCSTNLFTARLPARGNDGLCGKIGNAGSHGRQGGIF
jgi:hypothetical protein